MQAFCIFNPNTNTSTIKYREIKKLSLFILRETKNENYVLTPALKLWWLSYEIIKWFKYYYFAKTSDKVIKYYEKSAISQEFHAVSSDSA